MLTSCTGAPEFAFAAVTPATVHVLSQSCVLWLRPATLTLLSHAIVSTLLPLLPLLRLSTPSLVRTSVLWLLWGASLTTIRYHALYIRPILDVLVKTTYMACEFLVLVCCEWNEWHPADGEPWPSRGTSSRPIATVSTLSCNVLGAFQVLLEFLSAEG